MSKFQCVQGATSQSVNVFIRDSSSGIGAGLAGVAPAGGSLLSGTKLDYSFTGANAGRVNVGLAVLATVGAAYSSAGIVQIDNTNMIGWVRVDIPNAALVGSSGRIVSFLLWGGTNMAPTAFEIELTATNNQSATAFITGVNSLAPPTNWNLLSIDGSGRMIVASIANGAIAAATFAANALDAVWSTATRLLTAGTNIVLAKGVGVTGFNDIAQSAILSDATPFAGANIALIQAKTTNLPALPASTTNITAGTITTVTNAVSVTSNIKKNQALSGFEFPMFDTTDHVTPLPGLTVTAQKSIDGAAFAACTNSPTAISGGYYTINFSAADLNGNSIIFKFTATGADATVVTVVTQP